MLQLRKANIYANKKLAGYLTEYADRFTFIYDNEYIKTGVPIGHCYPLSHKTFETEELPFFFSNLAPEGWLLEKQSQQQDIDKGDIFGILLANGREMIGAVSILPYLTNVID